MTVSDCQPYQDDSGCLVVPECPAVAYVPGHVNHYPVIGWNAGANSIIDLDGDLHMVFTVPGGVTGLICGLRSGRANNTLPLFVEHGMYFQSIGGLNYVQVIERAAPIGTPVEREANDSFEIRRVNARVTYWQNGVAMYTSGVRSTGRKIVNACLYASGDAV